MRWESGGKEVYRFEIGGFLGWGGGHDGGDGGGACNGNGDCDGDRIVYKVCWDLYC